MAKRIIYKETDGTLVVLTPIAQEKTIEQIAVIASDICRAPAGALQISG